MNNLPAIILSIFYAICNVSGAALIKSELTGRSLNGINDYISLLFTPKVIGGFFFVFGSALILFKALSLAKFSFVVPIANGVNFAFTALVGYIIFSEKFSALGILALILILAGIVLLTFANQKV